MVTEMIQSDIAKALKSGDEVRVETLRFLLAQVRNVAIAKYGRDAETKFTDTDFRDVVRKQVKSHKESIEAFAAAGRTTLADKERKELEILQTFLPPELTDAELEAVIDGVLKESTKREFGPLMGMVMAKVAGKADGGRVASLLKTKLS